MELEGLETERQAEQLVAEADPEEGYLTDEGARRVDRHGEDGRIAGPVPDQDRTRARLEDRLGVPVAGHDVQLEPCRRQPLRNRALATEVDERHPWAGADRVGLVRPDPARQRAPVDRRLRER